MTRVPCTRWNPPRDLALDATGHRMDHYYRKSIGVRRPRASGLRLECEPEKPIPFLGHEPRAGLTPAGPFAAMRGFI